MQFGYFDDPNKEYVITRPDTPRSWSNYLGITEYGAIITNNAGGYSFYKSAAQGRFTRLRFNSVPMDQPGRYIYLHDHDSGDYWSASWQPVGKPLELQVGVPPRQRVHRSFLPNTPASAPRPLISSRSAATSSAGASG